MKDCLQLAVRRLAGKCLFAKFDFKGSIGGKCATPDRISGVAASLSGNLDNLPQPQSPGGCRGHDEIKAVCL